jgi:hypothetical protein
MEKAPSYPHPLLFKRKGHFQMPDQFVEDIFLKDISVRGRFLKDKI